MGGILEQIQAQLNRIEARLAKTDGEDMVDQSRSDLGPRVHCEVARRLIAAGDQRAVRRSRKYLMTRSAIAEALAERALPKARPANDDVALPDEEQSAYQQALRKALNTRK